MNESVIQHDNDTWRILGIGTKKDGKTLCHLASTTVFTHQKNGKRPKQITDWIDDHVVESCQNGGAK